jgi:hypothetical protein
MMGESVLSARQLGEPSMSETGLQSMGPQTIGLRSQDCYCLRMDRREFRRLPKETVLAFLMEEQLPVDAEFLAVAAYPNDRGWLVIATDSRLSRPLVESIEEEGGYVTVIMPLVIAGLQSVLQQIPSHGMTVVAIGTGTTMDLLLLKGHRLQEWRWLGDGTQGITEAIAGWQAEYAVEVEWQYHAFVSSEEMVSAIHSWQMPAETQWQLHRDDLSNNVNALADRLAAGLEPPMVNLAVGPLRPAEPLRPIRNELRFAMISLVVMLTVITGVTFWRGTLYRDQTIKVGLEQEQLFSQLFPGERIPVGMRVRFETELRRLRATRGASTRAPEIISLVPTMHAWLKSLPAETPFRLNQVKLYSDKIGVMEGATKSFVDVDVLRESLITGGFHVPPISSSKSLNGVLFRFTDLSLGGSDIDQEPSKKASSRGGRNVR